MNPIKNRIFPVIITVLMIVGLLSPSVVSAEENNTFQFGFVDFYSSYEMGTQLTDGYYYSDDWFTADPSERNDALALVSMQLTAASVDSDENGFGAVLLEKLGFMQTGYRAFDPSDPYGCSYTWGKKTISVNGEDTTLIAVQIQSAYFDKETKKTSWKQNFMVNGDNITSEHDALSKVTAGITDEIAALGGSGKTIYWITGHSRGGAIANLLAAHLPSVPGAENAGIYAYTFEAPAVVEASAISDPSSYHYIHNYICSNDIVTQIPMWQMTRYGNEYPLDTEETNECLVEGLKKLESSLYDLVVDLEGGPDEQISSILETLLERIPTRDGYSAENTDVFIDDNNNEISISYVYQDIFVKIMDIIFGEGIGEIDIDSLLPQADQLLPAVISLARAMAFDSDRDYYAAAICLSEFLPVAGLNLPLTTEELYALLKLAAPLLIDTSAYDPDNEPTAITDAVYLLMPVVELYANYKILAVSHHFEAVISRLKTLAPLPVLSNQEIVIEEPVAGDAVSKAPADAEGWKAAQNADWMELTSSWAGDDTTLSDNRVHIFDVELQVPGHTVPDDFRLTLNGMDPMGAPEITYEKGVHTIRASFAFVFGEAETVTITFADPIHADTPEPEEVMKGMKLKYLLHPVDFGVIKETDATWRFDGWYDENGTPWQNVTAEEGLTLYARWTQVIDEVDITFAIPEIGEAFTPPSIPDGAPYIVPYDPDEDETSSHVTDDDWNTVTTADTVGPYILSITVFPATEEIPFLTGEDEWGDSEFAGTVLVNGEIVKTSYDEESGRLTAEYRFTAPQKAAYKIMGSKNICWISGSERNAVFTVTREDKGETCTAHFRKVFLDGSGIYHEACETEAENNGDITISILPDTLQYQDVGDHSVRVYFDDGFAEGTLTVLSPSIPDASVSGIKDAVYTGKAITPKPVVTLGGMELTQDTDYDVSYRDNTAVGTATVVIIGKGIYTGSITKTFMIKDRKITGISIPKNTEIAVGEKTALKTTLSPANTSQTGVRWITSDNNIVSVDQKGNIKGITRGKATVTAISKSNKNIKASCSVTVLFTDATRQNVSGEMFDAIYWVADKKITGEKKQFGTEDSLTRGQFIRFLYRYAGKEGKYKIPEKYKKKSPFKDVSTDYKHYEAIVWAVEQGLIVGYSDGTFKPGKSLSRNNVATILWKFAGSPSVKNNKNPFTDVSKSTAIAWGKGKKIFTGTKFYPKNNCLRGEFAVFLYRYDKVKK